jgi:signal recognition particle receptor subunit beta
MRVVPGWPRLVFIFVPIVIVTVNAVVLVSERLRPDAQKAIRLVKESNSRKENFTVQQYLYVTVYHRRDIGEAVTIEGWHAEHEPESDSRFVVDFGYSDPEGIHKATWKVDLKDGTVVPLNEAALDLAWH